MNIVEGERYVLRDGRVTGPMESCKGVNFVWHAILDGVDEEWTRDGKFWSGNSPSDLDIVARYTSEPVPATSKTEAQIQHAELLAALKSIEDAILLGALQAPVKGEASEIFPKPYVLVDKEGDAYYGSYETLKAAQDACDKKNTAHGNYHPFRIAVLREVTTP